ncbi:MAG TPA: 16S rRNA processing protein RimM [Candidatus Faecousia intestinigallinarum]|nr:16S rRNA processing protein RimM [Candidatus Faecousia intestinigallinarum]
MRLDFLQAGEIVSIHGLRGDMKVLPWSDGPDFLLPFRRVRIDGREYAVENCRVQKTCNLLKLKGVDTPEAAQALRGKTVEIFREDADKDVIFAAELEGVEVYAAGRMIGSISEVLDYPGNSVYVVKGERSYMIPAVKEFILSTNLAENRMEVKLIEGMEIDAD